MLLNRIEKLLMNNPVREAAQRYYEAKRLRELGGATIGAVRSKSDAGGASVWRSSSSSSAHTRWMPSISFACALKAAGLRVEASHDEGHFGFFVARKA